MIASLEETLALKDEEMPEAKKIENLGRLLDKDLEHVLLPIADELYSQLSEQIQSGDFTNTVELIEDVMFVIEDQLRLFIPDYDNEHLRNKRICNWPSGGGVYYGKVQQKRCAVQRKKWADETELMEARSPRKVQKLLNQIAPVLRERYGRGFDNRYEITVMEKLSDNKNELDEKIGKLKETRRFLEELHSFSAEEPNTGWEDAAEYHKTHFLRPAVLSAGEAAIDILKDMARPAKLFVDTSYSGSKSSSDYKEHERFKGVRGANFGGHRTELPTHYDQGSPYTKMHKSAACNVSIYRRELSFEELIAIASPGAAQKYGVDDTTVHALGNFPKELQSKAIRAARQRYEAKDPSVMEIMRKHAADILKRWTATAVDYERIFSEHNLHFLDCRLLGFLYSVKRGKLVDQYWEEFRVNRIPEALQTLVNDGILKEEEIEPPLQPYHFSGSVKQMQGIEERIISQLKPIESRSIPLLESGTVSPSNALAVVTTAQDIQEVIDPSKEYELIYKGDHGVLITSQEYFPNGSRQINDVIKIMPLQDGCEAKRPVVNIGGRPYELVRVRSSSDRLKLNSMLYDAKSNLVPAANYTVITACTPEEFEELYWKDFCAHLLVHKSSLDSEMILGMLGDGTIESMSIDNLEMRLGFSSERTLFRTRKIGGRFGFQIRADDNMYPDEMYHLAMVLTEYLQDAGVAHHVAVEMDEQGRYEVKRKLEERKFQEEHWDEVQRHMKEKGLASILSSLLLDEQYSKRDFMVAGSKCEECGNKFMYVNIYRNDLSEQWSDGLFGHEIHTLAEHPETYTSSPGDFKKILRFVTDMESYTPTFIEHPEIIPELGKFAKYSDAALASESESYNLWECGIDGHGYEAEQVEDNPEIRAEVENADKVRKRAYETGRACIDQAVILQKKYDELDGTENKPNAEPWDIKQFWTEQLFMYLIYQTCAPELLPEWAEEHIPQGSITMCKSF